MKKSVLALILGLALLVTAIPAWADEIPEAISAEPATAAAPFEDTVPAPGESVTQEPTEVSEQEPGEEPEAAEGPVEIPDEETEAEEPVEEPAPQEPAEADKPTVVSTAYKRDASGHLILDADGNPIANLPEGAAQKPVAWQRDASGALVLDANGDPIPTQYVAIDAEKVATIEDVIDPNRRIDIYAEWEGDVLYFGAQAKLTAVLRGYDNLVYKLQWETSVSGRDNDWSEVRNENRPEYKLIITEDNYMNYWRVKVTVTDAID